MKILTIIAVSGGLALGSISSAFAQDQMGPQPDSSAAQNPAMKSPNTMTPGPLAKGRNSFTKAEAKARIRAAGYANIQDLMKDSNGLWQAKARLNGESVHVALDYKGNIVSQ